MDLTSRLQTAEGSCEKHYLTNQETTNPTRLHTSTSAMVTSLKARGTKKILKHSENKHIMYLWIDSLSEKMKIKIL